MRSNSVERFSCFQIFKAKKGLNYSECSTKIQFRVGCYDRIRGAFSVHRVQIIFDWTEIHSVVESDENDERVSQYIVRFKIISIHLQNTNKICVLSVFVSCHLIVLFRIIILHFEKPKKAELTNTNSNINTIIFK